MLKYKVSFLFLFIYITGAYAGDFENVDKYARSVHKSGDYKQLVHKLTDRFTDEKDKVRAIYVWITDNIKYDWNKFEHNLKKGRYHIKGRSKAEILQIKKKIKERKINDVYRTGKGVCEDYSLLFKAMCDAIGIKSVIITGKIRSNPKAIGIFPYRYKHAWNGVRINDSWYLIDATWGAGYVEKGRFHKKFEDAFFMTNPEIFIISHYPDQPKWQLIKTPVSKKEFAEFAYIFAGFYEKNILNFYPRKGIFNTKNMNNTVTLEFATIPPDIYIYKNGKLKKTKIIKKDNTVKINLSTVVNHGFAKLVVKEGHKVIPLIGYKIK